MSKQSNQRYRKEREKDLLKDKDNSGLKNTQSQDKINKEFETSSNKADK